MGTHEVSVEVLISSDPIQVADEIVTNPHSGQNEIQIRRATENDPVMNEFGLVSFVPTENFDVKVVSMLTCSPLKPTEIGDLQEGLLMGDSAASWSARHSTATYTKAKREGNDSKGKGQKIFNQLSTADKIKFIQRRAAAAALKSSKTDANSQHPHATKAVLKWKCCNCPQQFAYESVWRRHEYDHWKLKDFHFCQKCEAKFLHKTDLNDHEKLLHAAEPSTLLQTDSPVVPLSDANLDDKIIKEIPSAAASQKSFKSDVNRHHPKFLPYPSAGTSHKIIDSKLNCAAETSPKESQPHRAELPIDSADSHAVVTQIDQQSISADWAGVSVSYRLTSGPFKCFLCPKRYAKLPSLQSHLYDHWKVIYPCDHCDDIYVLAESLSDHKRSAHPEV